jgi:hypothetical protein
MTEIVITAEPLDLIPVSLVGVTYQIKPPKSSLALKLAVRAKTAEDDPSLMMEAIDEWVDKAFGKEEAENVRARLDDEDDVLDFPHIMALMEAVIERTTGNPTSSSSGSPSSPPSPGQISMVGRSRAASKT